MAEMACNSAIGAYLRRPAVCGPELATCSLHPRWRVAESFSNQPLWHPPWQQWSILLEWLMFFAYPPLVRTQVDVWLR